MELTAVSLLHPEGCHKLHAIRIAYAKNTEAITLHRPYIGGGIAVDVSRHVGQRDALRSRPCKKQITDGCIERVIRRAAVQCNGSVRAVHHNNSAAGRTAGSLLDSTCHGRGRQQY